MAVCWNAFCLMPAGRQRGAGGAGGGGCISRGRQAGPAPTWHYNPWFLSTRQPGSCTPAVHSCSSTLPLTLGDDFEQGAVCALRDGSKGHPRHILHQHGVALRPRGLVQQVEDAQAQGFLVVPAAVGAVHAVQYQAVQDDPGQWKHRLRMRKRNGAERRALLVVPAQQQAKRGQYRCVQQADVSLTTPRHLHAPHPTQAHHQLMQRSSPPTARGSSTHPGRLPTCPQQPPMHLNIAPILTGTHTSKYCSAAPPSRTARGSSTPQRTPPR
jgi:hypothetical protein